MAGKKNNFIERSISSALSFFKESVFSDDCASRDGFLQSLDPRIKTATFLLFIIQVLFIKNIVGLLPLYAISLLLACLSKIRPGFFLKRTWIFIPLFSLFITLPAIFSIVTPGETLAVLKIAGLKLTVTQQGLYGAALFVARVITSVSFVVLLSITTKHFELLKVLRIFKIPQVFVMTLGMCYRYIFLFVGIIENTYLAVKSRVGTKIQPKRGQRVVAFNIASLWQRSYRLNEDVYLAMLSRGYSGEPLVLHHFKTGLQDWLWLFCALTIFVTLNISQ